MGRLNIVNCPYMPKNMVALEDAKDIVVFNTETGFIFSISKFSKFEVKSYGQT